MKKLLLALIIGGCSLISWADTLALKKGHPDTYVVKKGDTLWDISGTFLEKPWQWPQIWDINPQVEDPHWIYPGDVLKLIWVEAPITTSPINKASESEKTPKLVIAERAPVKVTAQGKLEPRVRTDAISAAIPAIPLEKISAFLTKSRVVNSTDVLNNAPYVIAGDNKHIISGAGDKLFARGDFKPEDTVFGIFRPGKTYTDPVTGEFLGLQAKEIGGGRIIDLNKDVATLTINGTNEEIRINDRLLTSEQKKVVATFHPKAPSKEMKGQIIDVEGGVSQVGNMSIVALNLGDRDGLEVGDVLAVLQNGEVVKDRIKNEFVQLPDVRAGLMIVFRSFKKMSYALVVTATRPLKVGDRVTNP